MAVPQHDLGVEMAALDAARQEGWDGFFAENHLWRALFGLVFWEDIFAAVPGAFQHRFQSAPLDVGGAGFFEKRQARIEQRLEELASCRSLADHVLAIADRKWGVANAFVSWRHLERSHLLEALSRIEPEVLGEVLRIMVRNPVAFDSGFPDLFLFRPNSAEWKLWEVKGPRDSLRPEQEWWIQSFLRWGTRAQVARVDYT
jgi:VRR-NUC domain